LFGINIVVTNAWSDKAKSPAGNIKAYKEVFSEYAKAAEAEGVKIAIENCPHWLWYPTTVGNIAFSPEMWDAMFEAVPSEAVGLELDPSHLVWQGIDYMRAIRDYGNRIYAFHAKDTEILEDKKQKYGIIGKQFGKASEWDTGWWRYRIPGFGQIDWNGIFNRLYETGFNGPMIIEHEDHVFGGDQSENGMSLGPLTEKGLTLGLRYLKNLDILR
jgi:sugar phosphate isomerase/epimerase